MAKKNNNDGWLLISDEGFAQQNAGREPGHLIKELVQNSWDALDAGGSVRLSLTTHRGKVKVIVTDDGTGIENLDDLRTMFFTSKQDSVTRRGRFGRGFKEMLCIAEEATVRTRSGEIAFKIKAGKRVIEPGPQKFSGTRVEMVMPWGTDVIEPTNEYFRTFLPPAHIDFYIDLDEPVINRSSEYTIQCSLTTELFENSTWLKRRRQSEIELVPTRDEEQPLVYEMGIPVCPAEWTAPYHINIRQRVPMNPNRDAVMSGYIPRLHSELIKTLYPILPVETLKEEWVGMAARSLDREDKQALITRTFGNNIVRAVPAVSSGDRNFNAEAAANGDTVVNTRLVSSGFAEIMREVVPTAKEAINRQERFEREAATRMATTVSRFVPVDNGSRERSERFRMMETNGGEERVEAVCQFFKRFGNRISEDLTNGQDAITSVRVAVLPDATMSFDTNGNLTLAMNSTIIWQDPMGPATLQHLFRTLAQEIAARHDQRVDEVIVRLASLAINVLWREVGYDDIDTLFTDVATTA